VNVPLACPTAAQHSTEEQTKHYDITTQLPDA